MTTEIEATGVLRRRSVVAMVAWSAAMSGGAGVCGAARAREISVPDAPLVDRHGKAVRLRSDVWRDRIALVNFVFTTCSSFCSIQSAMLADLQTRLGRRLERDVVIISVTVDPLQDSPQRLAAYSAPFQPGPSWWWLTGEPGTVFRLLDALGASSPSPQDHGPLWLAGPATAPRRIVGLPTIAQLEGALGAERERAAR